MAQAARNTVAHAYLDFFHDLGIHDFYRCGQPSPPSPAPTAPGAETSLLPLDNPILLDAPPRVVLHQELPVPPVASIQDRWPVLISPDGDREAALASVRNDIGDCTRCPLAYAGRRSIVFGEGNPQARLMFVGEGPGADEDTSGLPFVGKAGQMLNNMIAAMGLAREDVYVANIVKCRPPANRVPQPAEANTCTQFLARQMDIVQPQVVVALGATAAMYLLGVRQPLSSLRGTWHLSRGAKVAVTYHPAFLLRDPRQKGEAWKDLQRVMAELGLTGPKRPADA